MSVRTHTSKKRKTRHHTILVKLMIKTISFFGVFYLKQLLHHIELVAVLCLVIIETSVAVQSLVKWLSFSVYHYRWPHFLWKPTILGLYYYHRRCINHLYKFANCQHPINVSNQTKKKKANKKLKVIFVFRL